jgi:hypothetical protein
MESQATDELMPEDFGKFKPDKRERAVRRKVYQRWVDMRDDPQRQEVEKDWDSADKEFRMYIPDIDPDDWRSHLELPDAFAAIQTHTQETIERRSRPSLVRVEESDDARERFCNSVMNWNMDRTNFDLQYFYAKLQASIRGTSFLKEYYRVEERVVKDPDDVDDEGNLVYKERKITDFDDAFTEWISTEWVYFDPAAKCIEDASDCIEREILTIERFRFKYGNRAGFKNINMVLPGGDIGRTRFFKTPQDLRADEVEILHYMNRDTDEYLVVANNVPIRDTPLPTKHKELPYAAIYHYRVPGRFWGLGIPKVVKYLSEERKAIRRLNLDRQKLHLNKMFLVNNAYDLDEEDLESRPHGLIQVETNGQALNNVIQPLEYGDVPSSYFRTEEILLEDIRRAHGIDDRIQGVNVGGTATESAILKESSLKRVNMIAMLSEMDAIIRIGRLKWSNIQFFYKAPRFEKVVLENGEENKPIDRTVVVHNLKFSTVKAPGSSKFKLNIEETEGKTVFKLDKKMARFIEGDYDVQMGSTIHTPFSKAIKQAKTSEMLTTILSNPTLAAALDPTKSVKRYLEVNEEEPKDWMVNPNTKEDLIELADLENEVMKAGVPLQGTEGATPEHTMVHLHYTKTTEFAELPEVAQQLIQNHILEEHDNNPLTGSSADLMGAFGLDSAGPDETAALPGLPGPQNTVEGAPAPNIQPQIAGQMQAADLQPANNNPVA